MQKLRKRLTLMSILAGRMYALRTR